MFAIGSVVCYNAWRYPPIFHATIIVILFYDFLLHDQRLSVSRIPLLIWCMHIAIFILSSCCQMHYKCVVNFAAKCIINVLRILLAISTNFSCNNHSYFVLWFFVAWSKVICFMYILANVVYVYCYLHIILSISPWLTNMIIHWYQK